MVMFALFVIMVWVYVSERISIARHPERDLAILALPAPGQVAACDQGVNAALSCYGKIADTDDAADETGLCASADALDATGADAPGVRRQIGQPCVFEPPSDDGTTVEAQVEPIRPSVRKKRSEEQR